MEQLFLDRKFGWLLGIMGSHILDIMCRLLKLDLLVHGTTKTELHGTTEKATTMCCVKDSAKIDL